MTAQRTPQGRCVLERAGPGFQGPRQGRTGTHGTLTRRCPARSWRASHTWRPRHRTGTPPCRTAWPCRQRPRPGPFRRSSRPFRRAPRPFRRARDVTARSGRGGAAGGGQAQVVGSAVKAAPASSPLKHVPRHSIYGSFKCLRGGLQRCSEHLVHGLTTLWGKLASWCPESPCSGAVGGRFLLSLVPVGGKASLVGGKASLHPLLQPQSPDRNPGSLSHSSQTPVLQSLHSLLLCSRHTAALQSPCCRKLPKSEPSI